MPNIFPWKLLRWSLVLRRFLRSIYFPTFLCLQALQCSGRVTFFQFILADKKLWEMARRGWLVVVIGRLDPLGIFFSLSGRHLCNIIKLWRMGTAPQFSCKKNQLRWGRKYFLKLGRKNLVKISHLLPLFDPKKVSSMSSRLISHIFSSKKRNFKKLY